MSCQSSRSLRNLQTCGGRQCTSVSANCLILQLLDQGDQHCLRDACFGGANPVFVLKYQDKCKAGLGPTAEMTLTLLQPVRSLSTPRTVSLCPWSRPGPSHPHPAPACLGDVCTLTPRRLRAYQSGILMDWPLRSPTLFLSLSPNSSTLAHCLFLSTLLVTRLFGSASRPPPVIQKAPQPWENSSPWQALCPLPTLDPCEPWPVYHLSDPGHWHTCGIQLAQPQPQKSLYHASTQCRQR